MRILGIVFFVLLAAQVAMLLFAPTQPPRPYQLARLCLALALIACIAVQVAVERARRRRPKPAPRPEDPPG